MTVHLQTPTTNAELEHWAQILRTVSGETVSVEELAHTRDSEPDSFWALAYLDDEPVGTGFARRASIADARYTMIRVLPGRRRRGVGSALLDALREHVRARAMSGMFGRVRGDDEDSLAFLEKRGFRELSRESPVALEVATVQNETPALPSGIEVASLADRPELARAAYEVDMTTMEDIPVPVALDPISFDTWRAQNLEGPAAAPEACLMAISGDEVVGYAGLRRQGDESAEHLMTGVRAQWRRRGIATALKRSQIRWAREAGITRIISFNDEPNAAIRSINERLGYKPLSPNLIMYAEL